MNATDQRDRHTAVTQVRADVETVLDGFDEKLKRFADSNGIAIQGAIGTCCAYADDATLKVGGICDERWAASSRNIQRLGADHQRFVHMTFWQRLCWFFAGRV